MINFSSISHRFLILILLALSFIFLVVGNGLIHLTHPDEVFYVQTAREMVKHQSWLTPYIFDHPQFEKPVFFYWILILSEKLFGATPSAARLCPALFGLLGVIVTYWLSWLLFGSKRLSFLAGIILCTSSIYLGMSRAVLTDMVFSFWVTAALTFFYWGYTSIRHKDTGIILFFVACGFGVLTKGLLGIGLPLAVVHLYLRYKKDLAFLNCRAGIIGLLLFLGIAGPWHIAMYQMHGKSFIDEYWYNVHVRRWFEAEHRRCDNWYFYPTVMAWGTMPWTFFFLPALFLIGKKIWSGEKIYRRQIIFISFWVLAIFAVMQLAHSKLASYILPIFPVLAIIIAYYFDNVMERVTERSRWLTVRFSGYIFAVFMLIVAGAAIYFGKQYIDLLKSMTPVYVFSSVMVIFASVMIVSLMKKNFSGVIMSTPGMMVSLLIAVTLVYRAADPRVSCKAITDALKEVDQSDSVILASKFYVRAVRFYTDRKTATIDIGGKGFFSKHPIPFLNNDELVLEFLKTQPVTYGIVRKNTLKDLDRIVKKGPYEMTTVANVSDKYLVRIQK